MMPYQDEIPGPQPIIYRLCRRCGQDIAPTRTRRICRDCYAVERTAA